MLLWQDGIRKAPKEYFEDYLNLDIAEDEKESIRKILERI